MLQMEDHDGQGGVDEVGLAGGIDVPGDVVDVLQDTLPPLLVALGEVDVERNSRHPLRQRQKGAHRNRGQGKGQQTEEVELQIRLQQPGQFFVVHLIRLLLKGYIRFLIIPSPIQRSNA